jgi:hypothetical protein
MSKTIFDSLFKIHQYKVSHKGLTLRSSTSIEEGFEHTDITFGGVFYMELPDYLENFALYEAGLQERAYIQSKYFKNIRADKKIFVLEQGEKKYYIGALSMATKTSKSADLGLSAR